MSDSGAHEGAGGNLGRLWRTVRHLSADQWIYRFAVHGRIAAMERFPNRMRALMETAAMRLPLPDPALPALADVGDLVLELQTAVYGETWAAARDGRFRLLNRDFDFGAIETVDWRGDFGDGDNPLRANVLSYMGYAVPMLATGDAEDLAAVARLAGGLEAAGDWSAPGVFRDVWNAYSASHRIVNLLSGLALHRRAGGDIEGPGARAIREHVRFCAAFVRANLERDIQFNHLLKNLVALSVYASAHGCVPAQLRFLERAATASVRQNVLADGGHAERSPMYHALGLLDVRMLRATGIFAGKDDALLADADARMTRALSTMTLADGEIALFNDAWEGEAPSAADLAPPAADGAALLPKTGYARLAHGGDSVVFDCGPCGPDRNPGHAHADFLSVETTVGGARFLVDTGVPTYTAGPARDSSRSAAAHNGPRLAGAEPIEFWKSFRVGRRGYGKPLDVSGLGTIAPLAAAGIHDGYRHLGVEVRRFAGLWPGEGMLVADLWQGLRNAGTALDFLIDGDWSAETDNRFANGQTSVMVRALAGEIKGIESVSCWRRFDVERPAHRLNVVPLRADASARAAVWFGWGAGPTPDGAMHDGLFDRLAAASNPAGV